MGSVKTSDGAVVNLDAVVSLPADAGHKAAGLQRLMRAGLAVPNAWVVLPSATNEQVQELASCLAERGVGLLAVRSSAGDEDGAVRSFAGVHESLIGVLPRGLAGAVRRVAESAVTERAAAYRNASGLPPAAGPCAVVVQELVPARVAGVAFGRWGGAREIVIEAALGLGGSVVDGAVAPEMVEVVPLGDEWDVRYRRPARQRHRRVVERGRVRRTPLAGNGPAGPLVSPAMARVIAGTVAELQWNGGCPLDLEWAESNGEIWWLQMRPQTRPLTDALPEETRWTRANLREVLPEIPSAFTRSILPPSLGEGVTRSLQRYGIETGRMPPMVTHVYGRPVFNEAVLIPGDRLGTPRSLHKLSFGGRGAPSEPFTPMRVRTALRHPKVLWRAARLATGADREATAFITRIREARSKLQGIHPDCVDARGLGALLDEFLALGRDFTVCQMLLAGALMSSQYRVIWALRRHSRPTAVLAMITAPGEKTVSTSLVERLEDIADVLWRRPGAGSFLGAFADGEDRSYVTWAAALSPEVWCLVRAWLEEYGHRGPFESDIAWPRYQDDARLLAALLLPLLDGSSRTSARREHAREEAAARAWDSIRRECGGVAASRVRSRIERLLRLTRLRERMRSEMIAVYPPLRGVLMKIGSGLAAAGRLESSADLWHLALSEVMRAVADPSFDASTAVRREQSRVAAWRRVPVPNEFGSADVAGMPSTGEQDPPGGRVLRGDGISPGLAEGRVRVLASPEDGARLDRGAILVAPATDPAWTPLFTRAAAVVTELGGMLSHAGIVAREFGIPAVANVEGATRRLRDGNVVRVDGSSGRIEVITMHEG